MSRTRQLALLKQSVQPKVLGRNGSVYVFGGHFVQLLVNEPKIQLVDENLVLALGAVGAAAVSPAGFSVSRSESFLPEGAQQKPSRHV